MTDRHTPDSVQFLLRLPRDLKSRAEAAARAENRTLTNWIQTVLQREVSAMTQTEIPATAYDIMRSWDSEAGLPLRTDAELDVDVPGGLSSDYGDWGRRLATGDVAAILEGRRLWGLPALV